MPTKPVEDADAALAASPDNADLLLAAGGARATAWRFREAIDVYSRGIALHPQDARFYRFRGHRYLTLRRFDEGARDLDRAAQLDSTNFDVVYHQGLAHYLLGHYARSADAYGTCLGFAGNDALRTREARGEFRQGYRSCMRIATNADDRVAMVDWAWRANRRAGRRAEADRLLGTITEGMTVNTNRSYYENLLMYKGLRTIDQVLGTTTGDSVRFSTSGYAVGSWLLLQGDTARARAMFERVASSPHWNGFGLIASEVELVRARTTGK
ncbi:MAG: hypothetical protein H7066_02005 [Cytophagaceae bacterium]|nr:hypothetical protein [Gemmatimonadaceae bacterium]